MSPTNATENASGSRHYLWPPTGEVFESVTTTISKGIPKPALLAWAPKMSAEFVANNYERLEPLLKSGKAEDRLEAINTIKGAPWRDRDAAANKGRLIHDFAEQTVLGADPSIPKELSGHVNSFLKFMEEWKPEFIATEMTVYSRTHGYAGTLDFIAKLPGLGLVLGDYKTNRSGIFGDIALQLAAYRFADFIGLPNDMEEPMMKVDNCVGIHIGPKSYKVIPVRADEEVFNYFLHARRISEWASDISQQVLSSPLKAPVAA